MYGLKFTQLLSGFGWLVRNGTVQTDDMTSVAPRTAIGTDAKGRLLLFEADGVERLVPPLGLTLAQLAQWMQALGTVQAINLDGGGSSTVVLNGQIYNQPHCNDTFGVICERSVTTVACIMP